ncbi:MAG: glycosyltransferase family 2 protein [Minisyncoccia bacterium]
MKVTIIIPTYNAEKYIAETIDSILNQTHKNIEIIVVDDGSTDNTKEIIKDYIENKKIIYFRKNNGGPATARNIGIKSATGDYIALLDADDIWMSDKLEKQIKFLNKNDLDLVYTNRFFIGFKEQKEWINNFIYNKNHLIRENFIINSSVLIKTKILRENSFGEVKRLFAVEDYDLWLKLAFKKYKFGFLQEKLTGYRIHTNQISSPKYINNLIYLYKKNIKETNNYLYKLLLFYMYLKMIQYRFRLKFK